MNMSIGASYVAQHTHARTQPRETVKKRERVRYKTASGG